LHRRTGLGEDVKFVVRLPITDIEEVKELKKLIFAEKEQSLKRE
jgi:hypothetical protein